MKMLSKTKIRLFGIGILLVDVKWKIGSTYIELLFLVSLLTCFIMLIISLSPHRYSQVPGAGLNDDSVTRSPPYIQSNQPRWQNSARTGFPDILNVFNGCASWQLSQLYNCNSVDKTDILRQLIWCRNFPAFFLWPRGPGADHLIPFS